MPDPAAAAGGGGPDYAWDLLKIIFTMVAGMVGAAFAAMLSTVLAFKAKRKSEAADECIDLLHECASFAREMVRRLERGDKTDDCAHSLLKSRDALGRTIKRRFGNLSSTAWQSLSRPVAMLDVAMDPADLSGGRALTKGQSAEASAAVGDITAAEDACLLVLRKQARTDLGYWVWGKYY